MLADDRRQPALSGLGMMPGMAGAVPSLQVLGQQLSREQLSQRIWLVGYQRRSFASIVRIQASTILERSLGYQKVCSRLIEHHLALHGLSGSTFRLIYAGHDACNLPSSHGDYVILAKCVAPVRCQCHCQWVVDGPTGLKLLSTAHLLEEAVRPRVFTEPPLIRPIVLSTTAIHHDFSFLQSPLPSSQHAFNCGFRGRIPQGHRFQARRSHRRA